MGNLFGGDPPKKIYETSLNDDIPELIGPDRDGFYYHERDKYKVEIQYKFKYTAIDYDNNKNCNKYRYEWVYTVPDNIPFRKVDECQYLHPKHQKQRPLPPQYEKIRKYLAKHDPIPPYLLGRSKMAAMLYQQLWSNKSISFCRTNQLKCRIATRCIEKKAKINLFKTQHHIIPALLIWDRNEQFCQNNDKPVMLIYLESKCMEIRCRAIFKYELDRDKWNYRNSDHYLELEHGLLDLAHWCLKYEMDNNYQYNKYMQNDSEFIRCLCQAFLIKSYPFHTKRAIKYNNNNLNAKQLDQRRVVFISLLGFHQTWNNCPSFVLYSSLLIIPLKRDWIYHPIKYKQELQTFSFFQQDSEHINEFIQLLQWKDSQGFVFWMLDFYECNNSNSLVAPFWHYLSTKLSNLFDPVSGYKYAPLTLDCSWWEQNNSSVLKELCFLTMKYKTMQTILHESNPQSLNVVTSYLESDANVFSLYVENGGNNHNEWWISADYIDHYTEEHNNGNTYQSTLQSPVKVTGCSSSNENKSASDDSSKTDNNNNNNNNNNKNNEKSSENHNDDSFSGDNSHESGGGDGDDGDDEDENNDDKKHNDAPIDEDEEKDDEDDDDDDDEDEEEEEKQMECSSIEPTNNKQLSCDGCINYINHQSQLIDTLRELLLNQQMICNNISFDEDNSSSYDPPKLYRGCSNIRISHKLTEKIIPSIVKGWNHHLDDEKNVNIDKKKKKTCGQNHLFRYMDKAVAMTSFFVFRIDRKTRAINYDFYDKKTGESLYCIVEEQDPNEQNSKGYKWKMKNKLFTVTECKMYVDKLPKSSRNCDLFVSQLNERREVYKELNGKKIHKIIANTKWNKIQTFCQRTVGERTILALTKDKFEKYYSHFIEHNESDMNLIPIIMFNNLGEHWIEYVQIVRMHTKTNMMIDIGVSFRYITKQKRVKVTGIHLDRDNIFIQHKLVSPQHECHCLDDFQSNYTDIKIGAFNEERDKIKQLSDEMKKYKTLYQSLQNQQENTSSLPNTNIYQSFVPNYIQNVSSLSNLNNNYSFPSQSNSTLISSTSTSTTPINQNMCNGYNGSTIYASTTYSESISNPSGNSMNQPSYSVSNKQSFQHITNSNSVSNK